MATRRPTPPHRRTTRPNVTSTRRATQSPRVTSRTQQPTTRGRTYPSMSQVFAPSWGRPVQAPRPAAPAAGGVPASSVQTPQYSLSNLPVDASYDAALASLTRQRDEGIAGIIGERSRTLSDFGFQEGPNGMLTFDPNNPFSRAAVMKHTSDVNRRSTAQTLGSGGQLYSGAFQNAQDLINRNQLQGEDALTKNLQAFLARNTGQRKETLTNYELAAGQAYGDRVGRFQSNPLYDPATGQWKTDTPPPPGTTTASAGTPAARASAVSGMARRRRLTGARIGRI